MATSRAPGQTSSSRPTDRVGTTGACRRPVAGRAGGPDSGSGVPGTGGISASVPHAPPPGRLGAPVLGELSRPLSAGRNPRAVDRPGGDRAAASAAPRGTTVTQAGTAQAPATVRALLRRGDFRRLLGTRLPAQFGDGVFQAALAGTVLFNPQRAAAPGGVAAGFAVLLLPYSLVGPFAGVWLDRWSRRQVLLRANLLRAGLVGVVAALVFGGVQGTAFSAAGLAVFSVNRFVLVALSAGLPHTTDEASLVSANALSTTSGAVATVVGGAAAPGLLQLGGSGQGGGRGRGAVFGA